MCNSRARTKQGKKLTAASTAAVATTTAEAALVHHIFDCMRKDQQWEWMGTKRGAPGQDKGSTTLLCSGPPPRPLPTCDLAAQDALAVQLAACHLERGSKQMGRGVAEAQQLPAAHHTAPPPWRPRGHSTQ